MARGMNRKEVDKLKEKYRLERIREKYPREALEKSSADILLLITVHCSLCNRIGYRDIADNFSFELLQFVASGHFPNEGKA